MNAPGRSSIKSQPGGYSFSTDGYDLFQMIFISTGELHFQSTDLEHECSKTLIPGEFLILRHDSTFRLSAPEGGYGGVCYLDYDPHDSRQFGPSFTVRGGHWLVELAGLMQFALSHPQMYDQHTLALLGKTIAWHALNEGLRGFTREQPASSTYWSERLRHLIQNSLYGGKEEFQEKMNSLGLSRRQLSRHFRNETGMSIKQYQLAERIREAKRLLRDTRLSVTDVAFELHYPSSQKFSTQFKQQTGRSPREYRSVV